MLKHIFFTLKGDEKKHKLKKNNSKIAISNTAFNYTLATAAQNLNKLGFFLLQSLHRSLKVKNKKFLKYKHFLVRQSSLFFLNANGKTAQ